MDLERKNFYLERFNQIRAEMGSLSQEFRDKRDKMVNSEPTPELVEDQLVLEVANLSELKDLFGDPHLEMWRFEVRGGHVGEGHTICAVREFRRMETEEEFTARKHKILRQASTAGRTEFDQRMNKLERQLRNTMSLVLMIDPNHRFEGKVVVLTGLKANLPLDAIKALREVFCDLTLQESKDIVDRLRAKCEVELPCDMSRISTRMVQLFNMVEREK